MHKSTSSWKKKKLYPVLKSSLIWNCTIIQLPKIDKGLLGHWIFPPSYYDYFQYQNKKRKIECFLIEVSKSNKTKWIYVDISI